MQALVDGQHGGDGDEEGGSAAAVQMADDGDEAGHQSNADDIVADLLHQRTDDLVEHACIGHDAEEQDGEDEQDSCTVDALTPSLIKPAISSRVKAPVATRMAAVMVETDEWPVQGP